VTHGWLLEQGNVEHFGLPRDKLRSANYLSKVITGGLP